MSYFVIETRTGKELQAKEMIKHLLKKSTYEETHLVSTIYALQTCTTYIRDNVDNPSKLHEDDVCNKMVSDSVVSLLGNLKKQYEAMKNKADEQSKRDKVKIKKEISKLEEEVKSLRNNSKKMKALIPGYIIIELKADSDYLPDNLWNLIMECPLVRSIPSHFSLPEEEIMWLFEPTLTEEQIEVQFETVMDEELIEERESELIHKANTTTDIKEKNECLQKAENLRNNLVHEVNDLKIKTNSLLERVKAFIRNKKETINMPVSLFIELYHEFEEKNTLPTMTSNDFLNRLRRFSIAHRKDRYHKPTNKFLLFSHHRW